MKTSTNVIIAAALLAGFINLSYAQQSEQQKGPRPERPDFTSIDSDNNGEISFDEFSQQELPHGDYQTVFDSIDADSDGVLTEQEFTSHKPPRPSRD